MSNPNEKLTDPIESFIGGFPEQLAEEAKVILRRLRNKEISMADAKNQLYGSIDAALNTIAGPRPEEEEIK